MTEQISREAAIRDALTDALAWADKHRWAADWQDKARAALAGQVPALSDLALCDTDDDEAMAWVTANLHAIRRDNGNMDYSLKAVVRAFQAGKAQAHAVQVKPLVWQGDDRHFTAAGYTHHATAAAGIRGLQRAEVIDPKPIDFTHKPFGRIKPECATEGCGEPSLDHIIVGGIGSDYCFECADKVIAAHRGGWK